MKKFLLHVTAASLLFGATTAFSYAESVGTSSQTLPFNQTENEPNTAKNKLLAKLTQLSFFTSDFSQQVFDNEQQLIQQAAGKLVVARPNSIYWHTTEPEESLIVSNGEKLWLYDPFIEQVSIYDYRSSVINTPILLLTNNEQNLWQQYQVTQSSADRFIIASNDEQSQVKSLTITFAENQISQLEIIDASEQKSHIVLTKRDYQTVPEPSLFDFVIPQGVHIDDQTDVSNHAQ